MSQSVSNGGIGKSPAIDKINQIPAKQLNSAIARGMKRAVLSKKKRTITKQLVNFNKCAMQIEKQVSAIRNARIANS